MIFMVDVSVYGKSVVFFWDTDEDGNTQHAEDC
jgi:hypothetical protein